MRQQEPIAQISQVRVNPQLPRIPERLDHLRLLREVRIIAVLHVALADKRLKIAPVLDAIGWVDVDHLNPAGHALFLKQRIHHQ